MAAPPLMGEPGRPAGTCSEGRASRNIIVTSSGDRPRERNWSSTALASGTVIEDANDGLTHHGLNPHLHR